MAEANVRERINKPTHIDAITLLSAVSSTGAGTSYYLGFLPTNHTWQTLINGSPSAVSVSLEGSIDNTNWFSLDTSTSTSTSMRHVVNKPINYLRANLNTWTGGTNITVVVISGSN